jgi:hypothetical protein
MAGRRKVDCFVYVVTDGPVVLYVGKGAGRRHLQSAAKHGGTARIVERFTDEDRAFARERELIAELMPTENRCSGGNGGRSKATALLVPKALRGVISESCIAKAMAEHRKFEEMLRLVGSRRYVAAWLLQNSEIIAKHMPSSKLDVDRLREVACGCRA